MRHLEPQQLLGAALISIALALLNADSRAQTAPSSAAPLPALAQSAPVQPDLTPQILRRLANASRNPALPPWQREFMTAMARDGRAPAVSNTQAAPRRVPGPERTTVADGVWAQQPPPTSRFLASSIYDPRRSRMVIFGGYSGSNRNDIWALSLSGNPTWTQIIPTGTPPSPREGQSAIYDVARDRMVVFGGFDSNPLNDVWAMSLSGIPAWTPLSPTGVPPNPRYLQTAIYDPPGNRMVVFGGTDQIVGYNDVWALSLASSPAWTQLAPSGTPPSARSYLASIYDSVRGRMLVFGGSNGSSYYNDVWALTLAGGTAWSQLSPIGLPPTARVSHTAVYDAAMDRMVVFDGLSSVSGYLGDVYALSLASPTWTQLSASGTAPIARGAQTAIYDTTGHRMVVFGGSSSAGILNDVWTLSLAGSPAWTHLSAVTPLPRLAPTSIFDAPRNRMLVFAGNGDLSLL
ncbi:MAG: Kelch repeat-containing protein, partial [Candidatus Eiseniibacteriota bacterium]